MDVEACVAKSLGAIEASLLFLEMNLHLAYQAAGDPRVITTLAKAFRSLIAAAASVALREPLEVSRWHRLMVSAARGMEPQTYEEPTRKVHVKELADWAAQTAEAARQSLLKTFRSERLTELERKRLQGVFERTASAVVVAAVGSAFETVRLLRCMPNRLSRDNSARARHIMGRHDLALLLVHPMTTRVLRVCAHEDANDDGEASLPDDPSCM